LIYYIDVTFLSVIITGKDRILIQKVTDEVNLSKIFLNPLNLYSQYVSMYKTDNTIMFNLKTIL